MVRDLTPEREWEEALRQSRERFQRFFANAPVGIALLDRYGRLEEANRALGELFGAPPRRSHRQAAGQLPRRRRARAEIAAKLAAVAEGRRLPRPVEVRLAGARDKSASLFVSRLGAAERGRRGVILHFIDATEQKSLEAQFAQSQKMQAVGQLAGGVAHDFNNLLTAMIGFCDLLLLRFRPGDPSFADIMQIKQNANRAANLVRQLLAFSRQQTLQPRVLNITDVLAELSHLLRRLIGENIELKVVHGRDLGLVKVDQGQLEQVIINLAVNARDAMPGGGTLTIRTANVSSSECPMRRGHEVMPPGEYVLIEVADTGIGIPKENLARIFEPFFSTKEVGLRHRPRPLDRLRHRQADRRLRLRRQRARQGRRPSRSILPRHRAARRRRRQRAPMLGDAHDGARPDRRRHRAAGRGRGSGAALQRPRAAATRATR